MPIFLESGQVSLLYAQLQLCWRCCDDFYLPGLEPAADNFEAVMADQRHPYVDPGASRRRVAFEA